MADVKMTSAARSVQSAIQQLEGLPGGELFRRELVKALRYVPSDALDDQDDDELDDQDDDQQPPV